MFEIKKFNISINWKILKANMCKKIYNFQYT